MRHPDTDVSARRCKIEPEGSERVESTSQIVDETFRFAPIPILVEDWSGIRQWVDERKAEGVRQRHAQTEAARVRFVWLGQGTEGYVAQEAEGWVGRIMGVARSHVREAVSLYTMFHTKPVGRRELRVCTSLPCLLRGAGNVLDQIKERLNICPGETTPGQEVTLTEVECLCACEMAPMVQLDERFLGPLDEATVHTVIQDALAATGTSASTLEPDPYISTDGPVLSTRFKDPERTWF